MTSTSVGIFWGAIIWNAKWLRLEQKPKTPTCKVVVHHHIINPSLSSLSLLPARAAPLRQSSAFWLPWPGPSASVCGSLAQLPITISVRSLSFLLLGLGALVLAAQSRLPLSRCLVQGFSLAARPRVPISRCLAQGSDLSLLGPGFRSLAAWPRATIRYLFSAWFLRRSAGFLCSSRFGWGLSHASHLHSRVLTLGIFSTWAKPAQVFWHGVMEADAASNANEAASDGPQVISRVMSEVKELCEAIRRFLGSERQESREGQVHMIFIQEAIAQLHELAYLHPPQEHDRVLRDLIVLRGELEEREAHVHDTTLSQTWTKGNRGAWTLQLYHDLELLIG